MYSDKISDIKKEDLNQIKSEVKLENIKSNFFLKILFTILPKKISLGTIKYNKKMKRRVNINMTDYKEYCEFYSPIEIELIPAENEFGKIINIIDKGLKPYYHIYLNDSKKDFKKFFIKEKVSKIKIVIDHQIKSIYQLFEDCTCIESIIFKYFHRVDITDLSLLFNGCINLKSINFSSIITNNVTDMSCMFSRCVSLIKINLSNFNTINVSDMNNMFSECSSLKQINISNFDTINVTDMSYMFFKCSSLIELDLSNFTTDNFIYMCEMFCRCSSLKEINLSNFNFDNVQNMKAMFYKCKEEMKNKIKEQFKNIDKEAF